MGRSNERDRESGGKDSFSAHASIRQYLFVNLSFFFGNLFLHFRYSIVNTLKAM